MSLWKVKGHNGRGWRHHKNEVALMRNCSVCFMTTHILPTRSVVKGHHVQDLLLFDKCAVAFDPTWTKGRWPWQKRKRPRCDIQQGLGCNDQCYIFQQCHGRYRWRSVSESGAKSDLWLYTEVAGGTQVWRPVETPLLIMTVYNCTNMCFPRNNTQCSPVFLVLNVHMCVYWHVSLLVRCVVGALPS